MGEVIRRLPWGKIERAVQLATGIMVSVANLLTAISHLKFR